MTTNPITWREKFDEEFSTLDGTVRCREHGAHVSKAELKSFFEQTLIEELRAVAGEVEVKNKGISSVMDDRDYNRAMGYNAALDSVLAIIDHKIENV